MSTNHPLIHSIARIRKSDGQICGAGYVLHSTLVCTCTHVVADALDIEETSPIHPAGVVYLDFPFLSGVVITAKVEFWRPISKYSEEDIALLSLANTANIPIHPVRLVVTSDFAYKDFEVYGFPGLYDEGIWVSGVLGHKLTNNWIQMESSRTQGFRIQPGFSGSPVWSIENEGVVGMVVASVSKQDAESKVAFLIPNDIIEKVTKTVISSRVEVSNPTSHFDTLDWCSPFSAGQYIIASWVLC